MGSFHPGLQDRHIVRCCEVPEDVKAAALNRPTHEFSTHGAQGRQRSASHTPRGGRQQQGAHTPRGDRDQGQHDNQQWGWS